MGRFELNPASFSHLLASLSPSLLSSSSTLCLYSSFSSSPSRRLLVTFLAPSIVGSSGEDPWFRGAVFSESLGKWRSGPASSQTPWQPPWAPPSVQVTLPLRKQYRQTNGHHEPLGAARIPVERFQPSFVPYCE